MSEQDGTQPSIKQRRSRKTNTSNQQNSKQTPAVKRPVNDDKEAWKTYWEIQGQSWRTEPEIDTKRQIYLTERREINPNIEQGIYPFKAIQLSRADVEWLLATHENGRGPVDWRDESQRKRKGLDLRGADLCEVDLSNLPLTNLYGGFVREKIYDFPHKQHKMAGALLIGTILNGTQLQRANLAGARLQGASLIRVQLQEASLAEAQLQGADFSWAQLEEVSFFDAQLERANFKGASLERANLNHASCKDADFNNTQMKGVSFYSANLEDATFFKAQLETANFRRSQLRNVNFNGAKLQGAWLSDAQLEKASFAGAQLQGARLISANLEEADLRGAQLTRANLSDAKLQRAKLSGANLSKTNLVGVQLQGANLKNVHLEGANLRAAQLQGADLSYAEVVGANLSNAQLEGANLNSVNLREVDLSGAQLIGTDLRRAQLNGARFVNITLSDENNIGPRIADAQFNDLNLLVMRWTQVELLGDEFNAQQQKQNEKKKDKTFRVGEYEEAVRAYRQLSAALRNQGLNEDAARFTYRAQLLQRKVIWYQRKFGQYLFSLFIDLLAGYGYRPGRSFIAYAVVISIFSTIYYLLSNHLAWNEAIVISMTAFHGRGFFPDQFHPGDPQALVAAIEAFVGLLIEVTFIATLTQRLFGK